MLCSPRSVFFTTKAAFQGEFYYLGSTEKSASFNKNKVKYSNFLGIRLVVFLYSSKSQQKLSHGTFQIEQV